MQLLETNILVRGTREIEPRIANHKWYRAERTHRPYTIEQLRHAKELRSEAFKESEELLPPLPCPTYKCMGCAGYRKFWDQALQRQATLF